MITKTTYHTTLSKVFPLKAEIDRLLLSSTNFSVLLLVVRIAVTHSLTSASLAWNLFLAFVPYGISICLYRNTAYLKSKGLFACLFLGWLLFIPNSFYIITDLFHLHDNRNAPLWYDVMLIFSFAWNGLLMGILSIRQMEKVTHVFFPRLAESMFLYPVMLLNAVGIFIGRYLRYNSWDVITNPFNLIADMLKLLMHPLQYRNEWAMVFCYALFMTLLYTTIKKISRMAW